MDKSKARQEREALQIRVAKVVWGLALILVGLVLILENLGRVDLRARSPHPPSFAVDGNPRTRWSSRFSDPQWISVDLGAPVAVSRVKLVWEAAYGKDYEVQGSPDGSSWTTLARVTDGDGDVDEHAVSGVARYVRVYGTRRSGPYGFSLYEIEVYGPATEPALEPASLSRGRPATASSRENANLIAVYWPLFLIVAGIPAILVPKDGGDQVIGLLLTGSGLFAQLRTLRVTTWGWGDAVPVVLIVAGLALLLMSLGRSNGGETEAGTAASGS
jgi:hypothetical protein